MHVLIVGHLVLDEIHTRDGGVIESFGGIYFPLSAFNALAGDGDLITPVFPVGGDAWDAFRAEVSLLRRVDAGRCRRLDRPNTRVRLFHDAHASYNTQLVRSLDSIPFEDIAPLLPRADLVYINFMTGVDLTLGDAEKLRDASRGLVYLDAHMIAYRVGEGGHRSTAPVGDWRRWVDVPDLLQCNERELAALLPDATSEPDAAATIFSVSHLRHLVVTKGEQGALVYSRDAAAWRVDARPATAVVDTTGCGDVFGSTFAWFLAAGLAVPEAGAAAARAGAFVAGIPGSRGMEGLSRAVAAVAA